MEKGIAENNQEEGGKATIEQRGSRKNLHQHLSAPAIGELVETEPNIFRLFPGGKRERICERKGAQACATQE